MDDVRGFSKELNAKKYRTARPGVPHQPFGWDDMPINDPNGNKLVYFTRHAG